MKTDYFLKYKNFYNRLEADYKHHGNIIIAYDFDDTVSNFSQCKFEEAKGYRNDKIIKIIKEYKDYAYFILYTARPPEEIPEVKKYIEKLGLPLDTVNKNIPKLNFSDNSKVYYNILLDDKAGLAWPYRALKKLLRKIKKGRA